MSARIGVAVMAALLALYIVLVGQRAWLLLTSGDAIAVGMGIALVVLPLIAAWALGRELWFGVRAQQLGRRLETEGGLPQDDVAVRPSGRVMREDGDAVFPRYRADAEAHPDDWRAWYRLGLAYDAAGDRRRAREAVRTAIRLETAERRG
ncbi:tetratricopeptide repeat protein [Microbacterium sp. M3]|jgi:cytochrome c-type biogenesis protein CcmH/NrfG|uniref:Tetratricopeptide repeat protein n=1 Tax=Microbacterium arthrosphaerae TaxID=792652 RepID=A0ABU4H1A6_9MICO|nr:MULTISPECIES: tetratricopeptide repeat protein [Microbacterium]MDW4573115.1 tetratricopeptide repeat protein [Microbacterium arthrosphaerae]MDW7606970.1 tetratricopeptide repeat protein [Microbacterium sp. M3]